MIDLSKEKLELNYPCDWEYKVVGHDQEMIECALKSLFDDRDYKIELSNVSSKGKFKSFCLNLLVHSEDDRVEIYKQLKDHCDIKYVL